MHTVGVVIVSFNTAGLLRDCLASLARCGLRLRIVVVDNASHDGSVALVREQFPAVELLALTENVGFARANNLGFAALGFGAVSTVPPPTYVLALNPDTVVHAGAIEALVAFLDAHPRVGMVGPRLRNPDGSLQRAAFRFPTLLMTALDLFPPGEVLPGRLYDSWWHGRYPQEAHGDDPFPIDHPLGACMLVRGTALHAVGGMDERYFMYSEEVEWCWRIRAAGWAIWQEPAAQITHIGGAATSQFRGKMLRALYRSRAQFVTQVYPRWQQQAHRLIVDAGMLRAVLRAWVAYARHQISREHLRDRLHTYGVIMRDAHQ